MWVIGYKSSSRSQLENKSQRKEKNMSKIKRKNKTLVTKARETQIKEQKQHEDNLRNMSHWKPALCHHRHSLIEIEILVLESSVVTWYNHLQEFI